MKLNAEILNAIKKENGVITTAQVEALGFSRMTLSLYVKASVLERVGRGIYALPDQARDDMFLLTLNNPKIVFSHDTALFLNGLANRTPFVHSVSIPKNASLSATVRSQCVCYYVKPELHTLGRIERKTTFGNTVACYNVERTLCDMIKDRRRVDEETFLNAVKSYAGYAEKDLSLLADYAEKLNVRSKIKKYLEVLL